LWQDGEEATVMDAAKCTENAALTRRQEQAALLLAEDKQSDEGIAKAAGVSERTLNKWKKLPAFAARIAEHREFWRRELRAEGLRRKENRIAELEAMAERIQQVVTARAEDPTNQAPGHETGLIVRTGYKIVLRGEDAEVLEEYELDTGLLKEHRAHLQQIAQELGQWVEKGELTGKDGSPLSQATVIVLPDNGRDKEVVDDRTH
jgi:hypothetical protein